MEKFKLATRKKVRFTTSKGVLSTEHLWDLSLTDLDKLVVSLDEETKSTKSKSFLDKESSEDSLTKLKFEVAHDILMTRDKENKEAANVLAKKQHNQEILSLIADKEKQALSNKSVEELRAMLQ